MGSQVLHVHPVLDLIDHELTGDDCPCGPRAQPVKHEDGPVSWLIVHNSLDGREKADLRRAAP